MKKRTLPALLLAFLILLQPAAVLAADSAPADSALEDAEAAVLPASAWGLDADSALAGPEALELDGQAILLLERNTSTMVYAKNIDEVREPASTTKIMTCLLALEYGSLEASVPVTASALAEMNPAGSSAGLRAGETYTLEQLLYCLMVASANDAALVIAEYIGGSQEAFVQMMNDRAAELGCSSTHFANPHGLHDNNHYTTARDLAKITQAALEYEAFRQLYSAPSYELPATEQQDARTLASTNYLISTDITDEYYDSRVVGGKTGFTTPAGRCVVCVAEDESRSYLAVVLGASRTDASGEDSYTSFLTASKLFDFGFDRYAVYDVLPARTILGFVQLDGKSRNALFTDTSIRALLPMEYSPEQFSVEYDASTDAPASPGENRSAGTAYVCFDGVQVSQTSITAASVGLTAAMTRIARQPQQLQSAARFLR